jgi:hypothetical protein
MSHFLDSCPDEVKEIIGKRGVFIDGLITPPLDSVEVTISPKGEENKQIVVKSDQKGTYRWVL